ncbi:hypothetical protein C823_006458 [Eubacterium plexicaudatum ASF492]|nr:hypothetical protein C823_006458 [Eubacterium plexicaudatum ASF492]
MDKNLTEQANRFVTNMDPASGSPKSDIKATSKDSVFRDLFGDRKYALQLYQAIHPEDTNVTESDISNVTIKIYSPIRNTMTWV